MKSIKIISSVLLVMGALLLSVPTSAQEWQSTSTMKGAGSTYSSQVTEVGATSAMSEATTTESYSPYKATGRRKMEGFDTTGDPGTTDPGSPIGDALLPLMLMAAAFGGLIYLRRRKAA